MSKTLFEELDEISNEVITLEFEIEQKMKKLNELRYNKELKQKAAIEKIGTNTLNNMGYKKI